MIDTLFSLAGRTALVTGASRGLGKAIALGLAEAGAAVVLAARDTTKLQAVADEIMARGGTASLCPFELGDLAAVEAAARELIAGGPAIDILVNNGAIGGWAGLHASTLEDWETMFDVNVSSMYLLCREISRGMVERKRGRIINFASYVSQTGRPNLSAYTASKHAVLGLTRSIAADLAPYGITCNAIAPGFFDTDMAAPTVGHPQRAKIFRDTIAMGRFGDPREIVGPTLFLASDASSYVTGHMLHVDGGVAGILSLPVVVET
jgi:NAD(P)-dependent dehydrogenase (short-subunit alcohol dehydrogenase family)